MVDAASCLVAAGRRRLPRARSLMRLLATATQLCRRLGFRDGLIVAAQLLRPRDAVRFPNGNRWYYIRYEPNVTLHIIDSTPKLRRLAEVVTSDDHVIVDLGAHSGLFAAFAKERSPNALAIIVEPDPALAPIIEKNLAPHTRWQLIQRAVSSECGSSSFYRNLGATQTSSLIQESAQAFAGEVERIDIEVTTLDSIAAELGAAQIDVLKLDVQGAERMVLAGASATLPKVRKLIIEVTFLDPDPETLLAFLADEFGPPEILNSVFMGADLLYRRDDADDSTGPQP